MTGSIFEKGQFTTDQEKTEYFRMMQEIRRMASEVRFGSCEYMKDNICLMTKTAVHCDGCSRFSITRADMMKGIVKYFHYLESEVESHKKTIEKLEKDISIYAREAKVREGEIVLKSSKIEMLEKQISELKGEGDDKK